MSLLLFGRHWLTAMCRPFIGIINMNDKYKKQGIKQSYSTGPYNKHNDTEQWIRISQGCPNHCSFCYEPPKEMVFPIPKIVRNHVKIMDMNLLSKKDSLNIIEMLGQERVNNKVVYYELICGIDHRYLTQKIADALKANRFKNIRFAWDFTFRDQYKIKDAITKLLKASYKSKQLMVFMICNWKISYEECLKKLYLCAIWGVKVSDCYFDGQTMPNVKPIGWTTEQIKDFRRKCRKHNQLVIFGIDPEVK